MSSSVDAAQLERDVWAAYESYFEAFRRQDLAVTAGSFVAPFLRITAGRAVVFTTDVDIQEMLRDIWIRLAAKGYQRSSVDSHEVSLFDEKTAFVRVAGRRFDRAEMVFERFDVSYILLCPSPGDPWRIASITSAQPWED